MINLEKEKSLFSRGYKIIGGIDEAGRGPLAGPVVAACVIIKHDQVIDEEKFAIVRDSKKLTASKREKACELIKSNFLYGLGICDHITIDRINILEASFLAMKKAIGALREKPDYILLDGKFKIKNLSIPEEAIIKGDDLIFCISAASIIAKVERDKIMDEMDKKYPAYNFKKHKGYGTKEHLDNLVKFGPCPIHRRSFAPVKKLL